MKLINYILQFLTLLAASFLSIRQWWIVENIGNRLMWAIILAVALYVGSHVAIHYLIEHGYLPL